VKLGMSVDCLKCTCKFYLKNYVCVHMLSFLYELGVYQFDRAATAIPLGQKRNPGRPNLLLRKNIYYNHSFNSPDDEAGVGFGVQDS